MVKLSDIAKSVGLNVSVVSRALSSSPEKQQLVKKETRELILKTAARMNYIPDRTASCLRQKKAPTILCFLPDVGQRLVQDLVMGISEAAAHQNFPVNFFFGHQNSEFNVFCEKIKKIKHSGIITYPPYKMSAPMRKELEAYHSEGGHILILNALSNGGISEKCFSDIPQLQVDDRYGGNLVAQHLMERKADVFLHTPVLSIFESRYRGFYESLTEKGNTDSLYSATAVKKYIDKKKKPGIFALSDTVAVNIMLELKEYGLCAGKDYFLIGYNDQFISARISPSLTTIRQPMREEGKIAVEKILCMLDGAAIEDQLLKPYLVVRETTSGHAPDLEHEEFDEIIS